ncbi:MAG: DUF6677 family protein [Candidatus Brocadiia bacterium]
MREGRAATSKDPGRALLLAWLLPGAGHWYVARRARAAVYGFAVVGVFVAGLAMGGLATVSVAGHKWAFLLQVFDGPMVLAAAVASHLEHARPEPCRLADLGLTFTLVSAAFNVLVMTDAYYLADQPLEEELGEEAP